MIPRLLPSWVPAVPLALLAPAFLLGQCAGARHERTRADAERALATVQVVETDGQAKVAAAVERQAETIRITEQQKDLVDAIAATPASQPDAARVALGCQRLRRQGRAEPTLPGPCRPAPRAEAGPA